MSLELFRSNSLGGLAGLVIVVERKKEKIPAMRYRMLSGDSCESLIFSLQLFRPEAGLSVHTDQPQGPMYVTRNQYALSG